MKDFSREETQSIQKARTTKEWKDRRSKIINETSVCSWCGSKELLCVHHTRGTPILSKIRFARFLSSKYSKTTARGSTKKEMKKRRMTGKKNFQLFLKDKGLQNQIIEEYNEQKKRYLSLDPEDVIVLCKRCHGAINFGKTLCPKCRTRYKSAQHSTCFECISQERKDAILERQIDYSKIEEEDFEMEAQIDEWFKQTPRKTKKCLKNQLKEV